MLFIVKAVSQNVAASLDHHCTTWTLRKKVRQEMAIKFAGESMPKDGLDNPSMHMARSSILFVEFHQLQGGRFLKGHWPWVDVRYSLPVAFPSFGRGGLGPFKCP